MHYLARFLILNCVQFSVLLSYGQSNKPDSAVTRPNDSTSIQKNSDPYLRALQNERTRTIEKLEMESEFPGGQNAWYAFLSTHLVYPKKAVRYRIEGTVTLGFIIDKDGSISDLRALDGYPILQGA